MFKDETHIITSGRRLRDIRVLNEGKALALEVEQSDLRLLTLIIPIEEALEIGSRLMVAAAEAKRIASTTS